ncbi:hypothetical protein [Saccharopolyspora pogona]|uniref:hypothetical protein n=1 Tax=Saccharopolyspora pogona TaxID=333966 RepID=UPI001687D0F2|nr:hypothetical protein [Saccharopolyspora pogona]
MKPPCVVGCGRQSAQPLCTDCWNRLETALRSVAWLAPELRTTVTRQAKTGLSIGIVTRAAETPVPVNLEASQRGDHLRDVLAAWMRCLWEDYGIGPIERCDTTARIAGWLLRHDSWCRRHPAAFDLYSEITEAVARCVQIVDRRPDRIYLAPCGAELSDGGGIVCAADLYGVEGQSIVRCRSCGTRWDLYERRDWMLAQVEDRMANSVQLSDLLASLGVEVASSTIRTWYSTGKLDVADHDHRGRPLYRVGDVMAILATKRRLIAAA